MSNRNNNDDKYQPNCRVFVGNIDTTCSKREVQELFEPFGKVYEDIRFHRGYGFIQYDNEESAKKAVEAMNGYKLRSKHLDVQVAHGSSGKSGTNNSSSNLGKRGRSGRRDDEPDNDYDDNPSKRRRREESYDRTSSRSDDRGGRRRRDRTSQNIIDVPIFNTHPSLNDYAHHVRNMLENPQQPTSFTIKCHLINLTRDTDSYLKSQQFLTRIQDDRFVIVIQRRNEAEQNVAFRAILPDGSSPGFADTPLQDVISFILQNAGTQIPPSQAPQQQQQHQQYVPDDRTSYVPPVQQQQPQYQPPSMATGYVEPVRSAYPQYAAANDVSSTHDQQAGYSAQSYAPYDPVQQPAASTGSASTTVLAAALSALSNANPHEKALLEQIVNTLKQGSTPVATSAPVTSASPANYYDTYSGTTAGYSSSVPYTSSGAAAYGQDYSSYPRYDSSATPAATSSSTTGSSATGTNSSIGSLLNSLSNIIKK